jgi:hypothetical protein
MKSATRNLFVIMIIVAVAALAGYAYVTKYVSGLISKTSEAKFDIDNLEIQFNHLTALRKAAENTSEESSKISSYIVRSGGSVDFITNIEQVAAASGLVYNTDRIEAINNPELDIGQKELLEVSFSVSGNWSSLVRFLKLVENMPYGIKILRFELTSLGDTKSEIAKIISASPVVGSSTASTTASSTAVRKTSTVKENKWKASVLFNVVKVKDN